MTILLHYKIGTKKAQITDTFSYYLGYTLIKYKTMSLCPENVAM